MNGAVFQTSAKIITDQRLRLLAQPHRVASPDALMFTNPRSGSKIVRHMIAVTTVSTAHGTSTTVRSRPRPLNALCMASAMPIPRTASTITETR